MKKLEFVRSKRRICDRVGSSARELKPNFGEIMKLIKLNLFFGVGFFFLLTGCAKQNDSAQQAEATAVQEEETEVAMAAASPEPQSGFVEYMWCDFGEEMSEETWAALKADFNEIVVASDHKARNVVGFAPQFETENFDGIWTQVWDSKETRDKGWADWNANQAEAFDNKWGKVLQCNPDRNFAFEYQQGYQPTSEWTTEPPFVAMYAFCKINDGFSMEDVAAQGERGSAWVAELEANNGSTGYWNSMHIPLFDTTAVEGTVIGYDFMVGHYWPSGEAMAAGMERYLASDLRKQADEIFTCENLNFEVDPILALAN